MSGWRDFTTEICRWDTASAKPEKTRSALFSTGMCFLTIMICLIICITWVFTWEMQNVEPSGSHLRRSSCSISLWWVRFGSNHAASLWWWWCEQHLQSCPTLLSSISGASPILGFCDTLKQVCYVQAWSTGLLFPAALHGTPHNEYFVIFTTMGLPFRTLFNYPHLGDIRQTVQVSH